MALTPARKRTTANSTVGRASAAQEEDNSDNSIVTEQASTANAESQTEGDAQIDPHNAPTEQADNVSGGLANATANNGQANQQQQAVVTMESIIPRIREVTPEEVLAKFPHQILTKIEGEPSYGGFYQLREEVTDNMLAIDSPFGGGNHGHWGMTANSTTY